MREKKSIMQNVDQLTLGLYFGLLLIGVFTVFAVSYDPETSRFFNFSQTHGKQLIWMVISVAMGFMLLTFDSEFFVKFAYIFYIVIIVVLAITYVVAEDINGARSWLQVGSFQFQPAEFGKTATALMLAKFMSLIATQPRSFRNKLISYLIIGVPMGIIILQSDLGSALVYGSLVFVIYREGFPVYEVLFVIMLGLCFVFSLMFGIDNVVIGLTVLIWLYVTFSSIKFIRKERVKGIFFMLVFTAAILIFLIGGEMYSLPVTATVAGMVILFLFSYRIAGKIKYFKPWWGIFIYVVLSVYLLIGVSFITKNMLQDYQLQRIETMLGITEDADANYNVTQSKMTIGSGGVAGKGYLQGTLSQSEQVPEQSTDFIFCTIGEEFGFLGTGLFLTLYLVFILRIIYIAERQRSAFSRVYAYCVASVFFLQIMINVGMTIGLVPVIGIPLPFISYGGSSVLAFSIMVFIMLRLDADRLLILR